MYKTIIMPVDVFEMELSDKAVRHAEFLAQDDGVIHLLHVLPGSASLSLHRFAAARHADQQDYGTGSKLLLLRLNRAAQPSDPQEETAHRTPLHDVIIGRWRVGPLGRAYL